MGEFPCSSASFSLRSSHWKESSFVIHSVHVYVCVYAAVACLLSSKQRDGVFVTLKSYCKICHSFTCPMNLPHPPSLKTELFFVVYDARPWYFIPSWWLTHCLSIVKMQSIGFFFFTNTTDDIWAVNRDSVAFMRTHRQPWAYILGTDQTFVPYGFKVRLSWFCVSGKVFSFKQGQVWSVALITSTHEPTLTSGKLLYVCLSLHSLWWLCKKCGKNPPDHQII